MKLLAKEEYGLRCMLQLARVWPARKATLQDIAAAEGLTVEYVAKLMRLLKNAGLIESERGKSGGYQLMLAPGEISLKKILDVFNSFEPEDNLCDRFSGTNDVCAHHYCGCSIKMVWDTLQERIDGVLEKLTLSDLLLPHKEIAAKLDN